ncbi:MAG: DUF485 domain-containing protein [Corynebacterium sp.]|uniref:DUF485 domain-containing protein n=1 Tax=Corynebacterium sp. TaxID=1720 RepID=UPI003F9582D2
MSTPDARHTPTPEEFVEAQASPEFQELRKKQRGFAFPVTIASLIWFVAYVLLALFAPGMYGTAVWGNINVGIILGLLQFLTTFIITYAYVKFADKELEPRTAALRDRLERTGDFAPNDPKPA